jgi:hypothetical protein
MTAPFFMFSVNSAPQVTTCPRNDGATVGDVAGLLDEGAVKL